MSVDAIRIVDKLRGVSKFSDLCESYLSPAKTRFGGRTYQLIHTLGGDPIFIDKDNVRVPLLSYLATAIKVLSYCSLILPIVAGLSLIISRKRNLGAKAEYPSIFKGDDAPFEIQKAPAILSDEIAGFTDLHQGRRDGIKIGEKQSFTYPAPKPEVSVEKNDDSIRGDIDRKEVPQEKEFLTKMTENLGIISYKELQIRFYECLTQFKDHMKEEEYTVAVCEGKSSFWMTQMALPQLEKWSLLPSASCTHAHDISEISDGGGCWSMLPQKDNIVLFDDCSYSGDQLSCMIGELHRILQRNDRTANFTLVVPFLSVRAKARIERSAALSYLNLTVITSQVELMNCEDIFTDEEIDFAMKHNLISEKRFENFRPLTLTATDWKIPDAKSFPDWCKFYLTPSKVIPPYKRAPV